MRRVIRNIKACNIKAVNFCQNFHSVSTCVCVCVGVYNSQQEHMVRDYLCFVLVLTYVMKFVKREKHYYNNKYDNHNIVSV